MREGVTFCKNLGSLTCFVESILAAAGAPGPAPSILFQVVPIMLSCCYMHYIDAAEWFLNRCVIEGHILKKTREIECVDGSSDLESRWGKIPNEDIAGEPGLCPCHLLTKCQFLCCII